MNVIIYLIFVGSLPPSLSVLQVDQYSRPRPFYSPPPIPSSFTLIPSSLSRERERERDSFTFSLLCSIVVPSPLLTFKVHWHYFGCKQCTMGWWVSRAARRVAVFFIQRKRQLAPLAIYFCTFNPFTDTDRIRRHSTYISINARCLVQRIIHKSKLKDMKYPDRRY